MDGAAYEHTIFGEARRTHGAHGYVAYFPSPIPRTLEIETSTVRRLADAESALGRLDGVGSLLANPYLLIRPYRLREALSSTRIEGTQASLADVLELETSDAGPNADVEEVVNYIDALDWGLAESERVPLSVRLLREMHARLLAGVRGRERMPGEFRTTQNWVGGAGATIENARFVPPPPDELADLLADWERFANEPNELPLLVQIALLHYQFETLHPFLDGNGRLGRLLIVFVLIARRRLGAPLLYVSAALERDRDRYYESLQAIRERGDCAPWFELFLEAVETQSIDAVARAQRIVELRERYRAKVRTANAITMVDVVCEQPIVSSATVERRLGVSRPTALRLLGTLESVGLLEEIESGSRGQRRYAAQELLAAIGDDL